MGFCFFEVGFLITFLSLLVLMENTKVFLVIVYVKFYYIIIVAMGISANYWGLR